MTPAAYAVAPAVKLAAKAAVRKAVRRGALTRPDACSMCGRAGVRIVGHHNDYAQVLDVKWLCGRCHGRRHSPFYDLPVTAVPA